MKRPDLVIFDCDGVLIDSEGLANRVVAERVSALGWAMTPEEAHRQFLGQNLSDMCPAISARIGRPVPEGWVRDLAEALVAAMSAEVAAMEGAEALLAAMAGWGLDWRVASNSGPQELAAKFRRTGLDRLAAGRVHSAAEVIARGGRGKPAPDLFLAVAAQAGVAAETCLVIEDSATGIAAAKAAGMACWRFAPEGGDGHRPVFSSLTAVAAGLEALAAGK